MRVVFLGTSDSCIHAVKSLTKKGYEVVIIEKEKSKIDELSQQIDCSFLQGDGSKPDILHEANPAATDFFFCFSNNDQANIIASLVGRSLGFKNIITRIEDEQYENVCLELGLKEIMIPSRMIGRDILDIVQGSVQADLSTTIKDEARLFLFIFEGKDALAVKELKLPADAKIICYYTKDKFFLADDESQLHSGDEIVVLTHSKNLPALKEQFKTNYGKK